MANEFGSNAVFLMVVKARKGNSNLHTDGPFLIVLLATSVHFKHFLLLKSEIYIQSPPNNSNETYTFMGLGRAGRFGQSKNCFKIQVLNLNRLTNTPFSVWGRV